MTLAKSTLVSPISIPNFLAFSISPIILEERIRHLEGIQPKLRQSPPIKCFSTKATFKPISKPAAPAATTKPAVPPPMTTKS